MTVQGPVKKPRPNGMSHGGGGAGSISGGTWPFQGKRNDHRWRVQGQLHFDDGGALNGGLPPGTRPPYSCWQKGTSGLSLATAAHPSSVLLVRAPPCTAMAQHSGRGGGGGARALAAAADRK